MRDFRWVLALATLLGVAPLWMHCQTTEPASEVVNSDAGLIPEGETKDSTGSAPWQKLVLTSKGGILTDSKGRQVLLRGINARVEGVFDVTFDDGRKPLEPIPPFGEKDCEFLATQMGYNLLRLPVNWSGIEPKKGKYNAEYLKKVFAVVDQCYKHGVYTIVDLHQDAYSKEIGEDGAPLWAIVPPPEKLLEGPLHDLEKRRTSKQVLAAFESFFQNKEGLQDAYAAMSAHLASFFKNHPGAVGFEIMNEPVLFGDDKRLDLFHKKVTEKVRAVAPNLTIFFEPNSLRNFTDRSKVTAPFPFANGVYSPHIYTQVFQNGWKSGDVEAIRKSVLAAQEEAKTHKTPLFVGEFGNDPKKELGRKWLRETLKLFDEVQASWALWLYEEYSQGSWGMYGVPKDGKRGELRKDVVRLVSRPYPSRLAGRIETLSWDDDKRVLTLKVKGATQDMHELTLPRSVYPSGAVVLCDGKEVPTTSYPGRLQFLCEGKEILMKPKN